MLVSIDLRQTLTKKDVPAHKGVVSLFALLSFGYMVPWVAIGSLIRYFSAVYGDGYFVILNVAFYAVGYPVSYIQRRLDLYYDTVYGSKKTFRRRIEICLVSLIACVLLLPVMKGLLYILVVLVIGIFTWTAHGASSSLASVVKNNSNIVQQIGFALPGLFALVMNATYHLTADTGRQRVFQFYLITASCVGIGLISWLVLGKTDVVRTLLEAKDDNVKRRVHRTIQSRKSKRRSGPDGDADGTSTSNSSSFGEARDTVLSGVSDGSGNFNLPPISADSDEMNITSIENPLLSESKYFNDALVQAVFEDPKLLAEALESPEMKSLLRLHMRTLFITIYCSILQGSFIGYTTSSENNSAIVIIIFYARLFMDLLGRPLALLPRPACFGTIEWLFFWSSLRAIMMLFFFVYIALPDHYFFRNDWFTIAFQCVFSVLSGYFNALTFEYAANLFPEEWKRFQGAQVLSITFQQACLAAVVTAAGIVGVLHSIGID